MPASAAHFGENGSYSRSRPTIASSELWSWRWRNSRQPVQIRNAANTKLSQPNADSAAAPTTMNSAAQHEREHDAVAQQPVALRDSATANAENTSRKTKTLSSESDFSTR